MHHRDGHSLLSWDEAPERLTALIGEVTARGVPGSVVVVGITGPVGSGKTTLALRLGGTVVSTDHYLPDYAGLPERERDEPRHADLPLLAEHLVALRSGRAVEMPEWCFQAHRRVGSRRVEPAALIVCEGIFALHAVVRAHLDVAVYVEAGATARWARWERIEAAGERGWGVERARKYFQEVADPTFARHADTYRSAADIVVANEEDAATDRATGG
ncbi:MAG: uridine kinase [Phycisphaerales bacterium JB041]